MVNGRQRRETGCDEEAQHCAPSAAQASTSDEALMTRVARQDKQAFSMLLERHLNGIHAFLYRMVENAAEAEELAQETFLRVWSRAGTWRPDTVKFTTWVYRIARNLGIDSLRRRRPPAEVDPETLPLDDQPPSGQRERAAVLRALGDLPESQRTALALCHYRGFSNKQAAQVLDISVDALESLLARARRSLKKKLAGCAP
ncbi:MAG: sigma-70 family RNA polymerase sigma factor [Halieaceae bacterium]|nr:sigma-70 family RNA polymerase sigma factor [Halieaceae bacterium]